MNQANKGQRGGTAVSAHQALAACALLVLAPACGGKYEDPTVERTRTDPTPSANGTSGSAPGSGELPSHPLDDCEPGFDHGSYPNRSCEWVTQQGQCFESFDAACACICPTVGHSVCSGGFTPGANGRTTVYCDKI